MRLIPPEKIIHPMIKAVKAGLDVDIHQLETHYLAGGDVARVVDVLIVARKNGIELSFEKAAAFDLGRLKHMLRFDTEKGKAWVIEKKLAFRVES